MRKMFRIVMPIQVVFVLSILIFSVESCTQSIQILPSCQSRFTADDFLIEANRIRYESELEALTIDNALSKEAQKWAEYNSNAGEIVHYDEQGKGPLDRIKSAGINKKLVAQNIARMPILATSKLVIQSWKSKKEEQNLVNPFYIKVGYGIASLKNGCVMVILLTD